MKVALLGDIGLFGKYDLKQNKNAFNNLEQVADFLNKQDFVVGNLETPFTKEEHTSTAKSAHIKSDPVNVELLKFLNIKAVNLANNHLCDYGYNGYKSTKDVLEENNINYFGIEDKPLLLEKDNEHIAFTGYCCYSTNACGYLTKNAKYGVNILNAEKLLERLKKNHENGFLNITSIHAGQEHIHYPNYDHVKLARQIAKELPYVFYGHHPHVIQGMEEINDSLIFYSLGNFCFDDVYTNKSKKPLVKMTKDNKESMIVSLTIKNNQVLNYELIPIFDNGKQIKLIDQFDFFDTLKKYSDALKQPKDIYTKRRDSLLINFLNSRKEIRDVQWYLKRINLNSIRLIIHKKHNFYQYRKNVREMLD